MMKTPTNRSDSCDFQPSWVTPDVTVCTSSAPSRVPSTEPRPPMIEVPPMTTAAMTASSLPLPTDWSRVDVPWAMTKQDARPTTSPVTTYASRIRRWTRTPARRAACGSPPMA
jgi:hypothetical protein